VVSGEFGDLHIDRGSVKALTDGLKGVMGELKELGGFGSDVTSQQGAGFGGMSMSGLEAGHGQLADSFEKFCERWEWGVRALVADANVLADKLGLAAGMVHEQDKYVSGTLKVGLNSLTGNPYATEDEVAKQSYGDIVTPDAPETMADAKENFGQMGQDWKDTGRAVSTEGMGGAQTDFAMDQAGIPQQARDQALDDLYGPSPEERAQQGEEGSGGEGQ
jgi:hypothetical protein